MTEKYCLTKRSAAIVASYFGLDGNGKTLSQKQVANKYGIGVGTVNKHLKSAVKGGFIKPCGSRKHAFQYEKGPNFRIVEEMMKNGNDVTLPVAIHTSGPMIQYIVDKIGSVDFITTTDPVSMKKVEKPFLHNANIYRPRGARCLKKDVIFDDDRVYSVKLQQTTKNNSFLYVSPKFDVLISSEDARDVKKCVAALNEAVAPFLSWIEKGGWKIKKDSDGRYFVRNADRIDSDHIHRAMRGFCNNEIARRTGKFGKSGDAVWADESNGYVEIEYNDEAFSKAIADLSVMHAYTMRIPFLNEKLNLVDTTQRKAMVRLVKAGIDLDRRAIDSYIKHIKLLDEIASELAVERTGAME